MPEPLLPDVAALEISRELSIPLLEIQFSFARSSGPGGQNVNKVNSKALLRWAVTASPSLPEAVRQRFLAKYGNRLTVGGELLITSQRFRDAGRNVSDCLDKLRTMLAETARPPRPRRPTKPSRSSVRRRLSQKRARSEKKGSRRAPSGE